MLAQTLYEMSSDEELTREQLNNGVKAVSLCLREINTEKSSIAKEEVRMAVEEVVKDAKGVLEEVKEEAKRMLNAAEGRLKEAEEKLKEAKGGEGERNLATTFENILHPTYAQITATQGGVQTTKEDTQRNYDYRAANSIRRRQILIDGVEGMENTTAGLKPKEIVAKANIAIEKMRKEEEAAGDEHEFLYPEEVKCISAKILRNGGVILEMATEETAEWIRSEKGRKEFEAGFGASAAVKERTYCVVVGFVPVELKDTLEEAIPSIEKENSMERGTIARARWMRSPQHWRRDQNTAHAVLMLHHRTDANSILRDGIIIMGSRMRARKLEEDPKRCFKCQRVNPGHIAAQCPSPAQVCPNCAKEHTGIQCKATRGEFSCASCKAMGLKHAHAAWDKACPTMVDERVALRKKILENQYKYWPVEGKEWTWAKAEDESNSSSRRWMGNAGGRRREEENMARREERIPDGGYGEKLGTYSKGDVGKKLTSQGSNNNAPSSSNGNNSKGTQSETRRGRPSSRSGRRNGSRGGSRSIQSGRSQSSIRDWFSSNGESGRAEQHSSQLTYE